MSEVHNQEGGGEGLPARRVMVWLMVIVFGGMLLRLQNTAGKDFFYDEIFTVEVARNPLPEMMRQLAHDTSPPLYFLLLKVWMSLSTSYENLKSFPVVLGLSGIVCGYALGSALFGRAVGLLTALLIALSPFHVRFSQELRMYTLYAGLLALGVCCLVWALRTRRKRYWVLFALCNILTLFTHYHAVFFIGAAYAFVLLRARGKKDPQALVWSVRSLYALLAASIALIPLVFDQLSSSVEKVSWVPAPSLVDLARTYCIGFIYYFEATPQRAWMWVASIVLFVVLIVFHARKRRSAGDSESLLCAFCLAFLPIISMFALSFGPVKFFYIYRYVIISLTPFLALLAYGLYTLRWRALRIAAIGALIAGGLVFTAMQNERNYKPRWRTLARVIDSHVTQNDVLIGNPGFYMNGYHFYSGNDHPIVDLREAFHESGYSPREFYLLQFNAQLPEDPLFPRLLRDALERTGVVQQLYCDWWFTFTRHTDADFATLRRWYMNRMRFGKESLPARSFIYFLDAAEERLERASGFAAPQLDGEWAPYRWVYGKKVALPLPELSGSRGVWKAGRYRLWMKCNLEYPEKIEHYKLKIAVEGETIYQLKDARGVQVISAEFDLKKPAAHPVIKFSTTTWVPKKWKVNKDKRRLAFWFYWLGVEGVGGEDSPAQAAPSGRAHVGEDRDLASGETR